MTIDKRRDFFARISSRLGQYAQGLDWRQYPGADHEAKHADGRAPTPENFTMIQAFEWYVPDDHRHWRRLSKAVHGLKKIGVDNMWIPPACKASSPSGNGYDVYDLYDLGEFDTKGGVATKWGTRRELEALCHEAEKLNMGIYFDAVLNHKAAADDKEKCLAVKVDPENRNTDISDKFEIDAWLGFNFAARGGKYSKQQYHWYHFTGTDYNAAGDDGKGETGIFRILGDGKAFAKDVDTEKGNFDYLMFADVDYSHPEVREDVKNWGIWVVKQLHLRGFRFDAIKHFSEEFLQEFVENLDKNLGEGWFLVGEFWKTSLPDLLAYLEKMHHKFNLFDAPLVNKFHEISCGDGADLRKIFDDTLVQKEPYNAVTLVANHDTQPSQALALEISGWFIAIAYALILLRPDGYPCLFYGDLYGLKGGVENDWREPAAGGKIPDLVLARKLYAYGELNDYMDENPNLIGFVRRGTWDYPAGCAVTISNAGMGEKRMFVGELHAGQVWTDILGWESAEVTIGEDGFGTFPVGGCSVSVYVRKDAAGRDKFGQFDSRIYDWNV